MAGRIEIAFQILIRRNGYPFLREQSIELLKTIERSGSLRIAAKEMHISYQHAWVIVNELNLAAAHPVVIKQRGGKGGGGAVLSAYGQTVLNEFILIEKEIAKFVTRLNKEINF